MHISYAHVHVVVISHITFVKDICEQFKQYHIHKWGIVSKTYIQVHDIAIRYDTLTAAKCTNPRTCSARFLKCTRTKVFKVALLLFLATVTFTTYTMTNLHTNKLAYALATWPSGLVFAFIYLFIYFLARIFIVALSLMFTIHKYKCCTYAMLAVSQNNHSSGTSLLRLIR